MKSTDYASAPLIGNQLLPEGDRPVSRFAPYLGGPTLTGHDAPASTFAPLGRKGLPPKGGAPTLQGAAHAHRLLFSQSSQRHRKVVRLGSYAASNLLGPGVGVRVKSSPLPPRPRLMKTEISIVDGEVRMKRTPFGLRPTVGSSGAGAHALTRAPALSCCMGCRP